MNDGYDGKFDFIPFYLSNGDLTNKSTIDLIVSKIFKTSHKMTLMTCDAYVSLDGPDNLGSLNRYMENVLYLHKKVMVINSICMHYQAWWMNDRTCTTININTIIIFKL